MIKILFIGDIVGKPGRDLVRIYLPEFVKKHNIDLVIANVENSAGGKGVTRNVADTLLDAGVDVMTSGNHIWDKKEALEYIALEPRLLRPANYPSDTPGKGSYVLRKKELEPVAVINIMGRIFMNPLDNPFEIIKKEIQGVQNDTQTIIVDIHGEATSEKQAMGWYLDGSVTAVLGTHTHVQTADERILPKGTAFITDVGMTGPHDSIIGVETAPVIKRFINGLPSRFEVARNNPRLNAVIISIETSTGHAKDIQRVNLSDKDLEESKG